MCPILSQPGAFSHSIPITVPFSVFPTSSWCCWPGRDNQAERLCITCSDSSRASIPAQLRGYFRAALRCMRTMQISRDRLNKGLTLVFLESAWVFFFFSTAERLCVISGAAPWSVIPVLSGCLSSLCYSPQTSPPALIRDQQALTVRIVPGVFLSVGLSVEEDSLTRDLQP